MRIRPPTASTVLRPKGEGAGLRASAGSSGLPPRIRSMAAFTMIEIALCLAIIGFALVAIIGVLPTGMNVQTENREETIIDQDAAVWMNAIRNGVKGYDDLTNYVMFVTNYWTVYQITPTATNILRSGVDGYTYAKSKVTSVAGSSFQMTNGAAIMGLLCTPKYVPFWPLPKGSGDCQSNYVIAYVRAFSGSAIEKHPQSNPEILAGAFAYKMISEIVPYVPVDLTITNVSYLQYVGKLQANSYDVRLAFRWPLFAGTKVGNGRQTFRTLAGGSIMRTNLFGDPQPLYFFQPSTYIQ